MLVQNGAPVIANNADRQPGQTIRVAIVEDDRATREGLGMLISGTPGYQGVSTFRSTGGALSRADGQTPDVLLLDIHLPGMLGSDGIRLLHEKYSSVQIIMLTVYAEEDKVFESICNGACGYLLKETPPAKLLEAISEAHEGGSPMSPEIARKVVQLFQRSGPPEKFDEQLTPHELRIL